MSVTYWIGAAITLSALGVLLFAEARQLRPLKFIAKPTASTGFLIAAWGAGALESPYGRWIFAALVLCWWGDVLLMPRGKAFFLAGLVAFLLGHLGFVGAFWVSGVDWIWAGAAAAPACLIAGGVLRWLLPQVPDELRGAVISYTSIITAMVILSVGCVGAGGTIWIVIGAVFFWVSDISVALDRFCGAGFLNRAWGLPAYFIACLILAATPAIQTAV